MAIILNLFFATGGTHYISSSSMHRTLDQQRESYCC